MPFDSRGWGGSWIYRGGRVNSLEKPKTQEIYNMLDTWKHTAKTSLLPSHLFYMDLPRIPVLGHSSFFPSFMLILLVYRFLFLFFQIFLFIYLAVSSLSCHTQDFSCSMWTLSYGIWNLPSQPGTKPGSPALGALDTGQPKYSHPISDVINNFS